MTEVLPASGPTNGSLTLNPDGSFLYTPDSDFNGTDSFTYRANDGTVDWEVATVTITVSAANDDPVNTVPGCAVNRRRHGAAFSMQMAMRSRLPTSTPAAVRCK